MFFVVQAPGTFGFKYRAPRDDGESIGMDEFGHPLPPDIAEEEPGKAEEAERPLSQSRPVNSHDETRVPPQRPSSPAPFADYAPASEKVVPSPGGLRRPEDLEGERANAEDEGGAGCCKCVIM